MSKFDELLPKLEELVALEVENLGVVPLDSADETLTDAGARQLIDYIGDRGYVGDYPYEAWRDLNLQQMVCLLKLARIGEMFSKADLVVHNPHDIHLVDEGEMCDTCLSESDDTHKIS